MAGEPAHVRARARRSAGRGAAAADVDGEANESTGLLRDSDDELHPDTSKDTWAGAEDLEGLTWWRTPSVYWLLGPWFLFILAFGGTLVPKLNLIIELICREHFADMVAQDPDFIFLPIVPGGNNGQCQIAPVQKAAARITLTMSLVVGLCSAVIAPKLGHLSDMYGRTRWLALSSAGGLVAEVITIMAAEFPETFNYRWIVLGSVFDGLAGSFTAGSILTHSYVSDCTRPSHRSVAIGYVHACLFAGLAAGPILAAYFVERTGRLVSIFYVTFACHAFFALFVLVVMPESVSPRRQLLARERHAKELADRAPDDGSWLASLRHRNPLAPLRILHQKQPGAPALFRRNVVTLAAIDTTLMGVAMGVGTCIILYTEFVFGWGNLETSKYISAVSTVRAFVLLAVLPFVNYVFRTRPAAQRRRLELAAGRSGAVVEGNRGSDALDLWIIRLALASDVLGAMGYLFARGPALFVLGGMVTAVGGLGSATIQATMTKHVPPDRVGQLLGAVGLLHALARVLSPLAFNGLYHATLETYPSAIFGLLVAMFALSLLASMLVRTGVYLPDETSLPHGAEGEGEGEAEAGVGVETTREDEEARLL